MDEALTDIEKAWLVGVDALLVQNTMDAHAAVAGRMVDLWGCGGVAFRNELVKRALLWKRRHAQLQQLVVDAGGPCNRLLQLNGYPQPKNRNTNRPKPKPKSKPGGSSVVPSRRAYTPVQKITEDEQKKFVELIETEGISAVFDPGVSIIDDILFRPPLIVFGKVCVFHEDIAPAYERGEIERAWDPVEREPAIALAFDLTLLVILKEKKWTWVISDQYLKRLPWGHPCKKTPEGRPGWKLLTGLLEGAGLVEWKRGQTWRLMKPGRQVANEHIMPFWIAAGTPRRG